MSDFVSTHSRLPNAFTGLGRKMVWNIKYCTKIKIYHVFPYLKMSNFLKAYTHLAKKEHVTLL